MGGSWDVNERSLTKQYSIAIPANAVLYTSILKHRYGRCALLRRYDGCSKEPMSEWLSSIGIAVIRAFYTALLEMFPKPDCLSPSGRVIEGRSPVAVCLSPVAVWIESSLPICRSPSGSRAAAVGRSPSGSRAGLPVAVWPSDRGPVACRRLDREPSACRRSPVAVGAAAGRCVGRCRSLCGAAAGRRSPTGKEGWTAGRRSPVAGIEGWTAGRQRAE